MYIYNIGFNSCEESEFTQMMFELKLSDKDLQKYVSDAVIRVLHNITINAYNNQNIVGFYGVSYENIHEYVIEELRKVGFKPIKFQAEWMCFGWASLTTDDDWQGDRDENLDKLYQEIPDKVKTKINVMKDNCRKKFMEEIK